MKTDPDRNPTDATIVYVWSDAQCKFVPVRADRAVCSECTQSFNADTWVWDGGRIGDYPFLVCDCGEQFAQTND
jgi:hydrogenase maturation factor HypF (carbamoyltransferase family)